MNNRTFCFLLFLLCASSVAFAGEAAGESAAGEIEMPRPEYPRPQFVRPECVNPDGKWTFAFDLGKSGKERGLSRSRRIEREILVPLCYEGQPDIVDEYGGIKWIFSKLQITKRGEEGG